MTLQEQLPGEQESTSELLELVDELKVRIEKAERELEEFKQPQHEYNRLSELVLCLSSPGN
jgi:phage shock protein A